MVFFYKRVNVTPGGFGEVLRELRELRGYSLEEIAKVSGIHVSIIKIFEDERIDELLDPYFEVRHVRTLIKILEGQPAYYLEKYYNLLSDKGLVKDGETLLKPRIRSIELLVSSKILAFVGFLVLTALVAGYVVWYARALSSSPNLIVTSPDDGARLEESFVVIFGETDPTATVTINSERAVVDEDGKFNITVDIPRGMTTLTIQAKRRYGSETSIVRHVVYDRERIIPEQSDGTSTIKTATTTSESQKPSP
ncbi:MAG: helix-turn-helix domain-containing protein [Patescibacteria group bacterium]